MSVINGTPVGSYSHLGKTFTLVDDNGTELVGVITENEVKFTATDNDVRLGSIYASDNGISTGTKEIPAYHTTAGYKVVSAGSACTLTAIPRYDYTKLQALFCAFNTSLANSVATEKVCINDGVYAVGSTDIIANVTTNAEDKAIIFGITNESNAPIIIRYFMYKEEF